MKRFIKFICVVLAVVQFTTSCSKFEPAHSKDEQTQTKNSEEEDEGTNGQNSQGAGG